MNFFIGGWLTISSLVVLVGAGTQVGWQPSFNNSLVLVEYYEPSGNNHSSMLNKGNYKVTGSDGRTIRIDSIAIVKEIIDVSGSIVPSYSTVIALKTEKLKYKTIYMITVENVRNKTGVIQPSDTSYYYYGGYHPNLVRTPEATLE